MTHYAEKDIADSKVDSRLPLWEELYKAAFPDMVSMQYIEDLQLQNAGVDRILTMKDGKTIKVDDKLRKENYPDVALEYASAWEFRTPGWMEKKGLLTEYVGYDYKPCGACGFVIPYPPLKEVWMKYRHVWLKKYYIVRAINYGYTTLSVAVPIEVILDLVPGIIQVNTDRLARALNVKGWQPPQKSENIDWLLDA